MTTDIMDNTETTVSTGVNEACMALAKFVPDCRTGALQGGYYGGAR